MGGTVKSISWLPGREETQTQYLLVGAHRQPDQYHRLGEIYSGGNVIQLWAFSPCLEYAKLEFCIAYNQACCWDLKWLPLLPFPTGDDRAQSILHYFAAAFGDGKIRIFGCPHPRLFDGKPSPKRFRDDRDDS